jgi:hypothetical protein
MVKRKKKMNKWTHKRSKKVQNRKRKEMKIKSMMMKRENKKRMRMIDHKRVREGQVKIRITKMMRLMMTLQMKMNWVIWKLI